MIASLKVGERTTWVLSVLRRNPGRDSGIEYVPHSRFWILESENVTDIGALYKAFPFILVFESKTAKE